LEAGRRVAAVVEIMPTAVTAHVARKSGARTGRLTGVRGGTLRKTDAANVSLTRK